jgi:hypothetical protein
MAPCGPAPEMESKLTSFSAPVAARNASNFSTVSISVSAPFGASRANQARNRVSAWPSRIWARRVPASSASFLHAGQWRGSGARMIFAPACSRRWKIAAAAQAGSASAVLSFSASSAGSNPAARARAHFVAEMGRNSGELSSHP